MGCGVWGVWGVGCGVWGVGCGDKRTGQTGQKLYIRWAKFYPPYI